MAGDPSAGPSRKKLGPYELVQWLATGGMAEVYVARRTGAYGFTKSVAVKRILPQFAKDAEFTAMFIDEARICARLSHPNLVEVFDFGEDHGELFMAMELVDGTTCAKLVRAAAARGETVPLEDTLHIILNTLRGLDYAHSATDEAGNPLKLVHRDVSPGNVLISRTGTVKLGDFGIVRAAHLDRRTEQGQLKGKLGYMSPEQVLGREVDQRSDLFTLGIVMAELLTGRPLFAQGQELDILFRIRDADTAAFTKHAASVPDELKSVVYRALAKDPKDRFQTAYDFAESIEDVVRRKRLALGPSRLAAYLEYIGLIKPTSRSGEYRLNVPGTIAGQEPSRAKIDVRPPSSGKMRAAEPVDPDAVSNPATYRVRLPDGSTTPPMPLARVLELVVSGRAAADSPVSRDAGPFVPAKEHAELRRVTSSSAHRWDVNAAADAASRHRIDRSTLPYYLFEIATKRETGVLLASNGERRKKIYFVDGLVEFASSTDSEELLGQRLVKEGLILPLELDMALAVAPRYGGRLGEALVGLSILRPIEVFRALADQMRSRIYDLLAWRSGELLFIRGARSHEETLPQAAPPFELIARGVVESYGEDELAEILHPFRESIPRPGARTAPSPIVLRLSDGETAALLAVDGKATIEDVIRVVCGRGMAKPIEALRGLFLGISAKIVVLPEWPLAQPFVGPESVPTLPRQRGDE